MQFYPRLSSDLLSEILLWITSGIIFFFGISTFYGIYLETSKQASLKIPSEILPGIIIVLGKATCLSQIISEEIRQKCCRNIIKVYCTKLIFLQEIF